MESNPDSTFHHILTQIQLFSNMNVKWITQIWISNNIRRFYLHIFFIDYCRKINKKIETKVWVHLSINTSIVYLYYKDPKQLKMFLTQNNSRIALIEVPPSMSRGLLESGENRMLKWLCCFLLFFSPKFFLPAHRTRSNVSIYAADNSAIYYPTNRLFVSFQRKPIYIHWRILSNMSMCCYGRRSLAFLNDLESITSNNFLVI